MPTPISLSKSKMEVYLNCPRCFWLSQNGDVDRPQGIRAGVPMGIDSTFKKHYDEWRAKGVLPPEIADFPDFQGWRLYKDSDGPTTIKKLRYWRSGPAFVVGHVTVQGALDDLLFNPATGEVAVLDVKSKAKATNEDDTRKYYELQGQVYDLGLKESGFKSAGWAAFIYVYPKAGGLRGDDGDLRMVWGVQPIILRNLDHERPRALAKEIGRALASPDMPRAGADCEYCAFVNNRVGAGAYLKAAGA